MLPKFISDPLLPVFNEDNSMPPLIWAAFQLSSAEHGQGGCCVLSAAAMHTLV